jgi:hypothetical protein
MNEYQKYFTLFNIINKIIVPYVTIKHRSYGFNL